MKERGGDNGLSVSGLGFRFWTGLRTSPLITILVFGLCRLDMTTFTTNVSCPNGE